jgi:hypothetical protein
MPSIRIRAAVDQSQHRRDLPARQRAGKRSHAGFTAPDQADAHELGHYVLGHDSVIQQASSQAEYQRVQERRELDANAKAVEILVRVQGAEPAGGRQDDR